MKKDTLNSYPEYCKTQFSILAVSTPCPNPMDYREYMHNGILIQAQDMVDEHILSEWPKTLNYAFQDKSVPIRRVWRQSAICMPSTVLWSQISRIPFSGIIWPISCALLRVTTPIIFSYSCQSETSVPPPVRRGAQHCAQESRLRRHSIGPSSFQKCDHPSRLSDAQIVVGF